MNGNVQDVYEDQPQVFKVQWPIIGDTVLIYNEQRDITFQVPTSFFIDGQDDEISAYLMQYLKTYCMGHLVPDGKGAFQFHIDSWLAEEDYPQW